MSQMNWRLALTDLGQRIGNDFKFRNRLAEFLGVTDPTIYKWFKQTSNPLGLVKIKVRHILSYIGYDIGQTESDSIHDLSLLLTLGDLDFKTTADNFGISEEHLLRVIHRNSGTTNEIVGLINLTVEEHADKLKTIYDKPIIHELKKLCENRQAIPPQVIDIVPDLTDSVPVDKKQLIEMFVAMANAIKPLAAILASDTISAEDREKIRIQMGKYGIFELKNDMIRLCGERARNSITEKV